MSNAPPIDRRGNRQSSALPYKARELITYREVARTPLGRDWLLKRVHRWVNPLSLVWPLFVAAPLMRVEITAHYLLLAISGLLERFERMLLGLWWCAAPVTQIIVLIIVGTSDP